MTTDQARQLAELREQLRLLDEATATIGNGYADLGKAVTSVAESGKAQGKELAQLATMLATFMGTTRATLELLAERIDDVAKAQGRVPPPDPNDQEHLRN